jgi:hypothetical protein
MRSGSAHGEVRSVLLGAMACCVRGEMETAIELLNSHPGPDVPWGEIGVEMVRERITALAAVIQRDDVEVAEFVAASGVDVRARWVLQTACWEIAGDERSRSGYAELQKAAALHNAASAAMALTALVHAEAGLLGVEDARLAERLCLQEALAQTS